MINFTVTFEGLEEQLLNEVASWASFSRKDTFNILAYGPLRTCLKRKRLCPSLGQQSITKSYNAWRHCHCDISCHFILIHDVSRVLFILHLAWTTAV